MIGNRLRIFSILGPLSTHTHTHCNVICFPIIRCSPKNVGVYCFSMSHFSSVCLSLCPLNTHSFRHQFIFHKKNTDTVDDFRRRPFNFHCIHWFLGVSWSDSCRFCCSLWSKTPERHRHITHTNANRSGENNESDNEDDMHSAPTTDPLVEPKSSTRPKHSINCLQISVNISILLCVCVFFPPSFASWLLVQLFVFSSCCFVFGLRLFKIRFILAGASLLLFYVDNFLLSLLLLLCFSFSFVPFFRSLLWFAISDALSRHK